MVERLNTVEMMEPELSGQGSLRPNCQQRVGVHLMAHDKLFKLNGMIFTDQISQFQIVSQKGNQYTMVLHNSNSNTILAEGCKTRAATELTAAYEIFIIY